MIKLIFISILAILISCKKDLSISSVKTEKNKDSTYFRDKKQVIPISDTINHFNSKPIVSLDSLDINLRKELLARNKDLDAISLNKSLMVDNVCNKYITNLLFLPNSVVKGAEYSSTKMKYSVLDLYYPTKKEIQDVLKNIDRQVLLKTNENESFISYFKSCGIYLLIRKNKMTILKNNNCWESKSLNQFITHNKKNYDKIIFINITYDVPKNKEVVRLIEIEK